MQPRQYRVPNGSLPYEGLVEAFQKAPFQKRRIRTDPKRTWFQVDRTNITAVRFYPVRESGTLTLVYGPRIANWRGWLLWVLFSVKVIRWWLLERKWNRLVADVEQFLVQSPELNGPSRGRSAAQAAGT